MKKSLFSLSMLFFLLLGCAGVPVREEVKIDAGLPAGKIEGNQFVGVRYPFKVSAPPGWKLTTEIPDFMQGLGYERGGLEESEVFLYNPSTLSNVQIDLTPAGRYARFNQEMIEWLTAAATGGFAEELQEDYGKDVKAEIGPTERVSLKGVQFAARKYATYSVKGVNREQGWIYGFTEPYQIFILYMIVGKDKANDVQAFQMILDSFEMIPKK